MKKLSIALCVLGFSNASVWAADVAMNCVNDRGDVVTTLTVGADGRVALHEDQTLENFITHDKTVVSKDRTIELAGTMELGATWGNMLGKDPVWAFVSNETPGDAYMEIATEADAGTIVHPAEYVISRTSRQMSCTEGPAYSDLTALTAGTGVITKADVQDYWDDQLALSCTNRADTSVIYKIRALSFGYAHSSLQISKPGDPGPTELGTFQDSVDSVKYFEDPTSATGQTIVLNKNANVVNLKNSYDVQYNDGTQVLNLACEERWAMQNIFRPIAEKEAMATALPSPAGTRDQVSAALCDPSAGKDVETILGRYQDLLQTVPNVVGFGIGMAEAADHPLGQRCVKFDIFVKEGTDDSMAKAAIGESLEGVFVTYSFMGPFRLE